MLRVGQGWDVHRLIEGGPLRLAGIDVPHDRRSKAHSDGDVVLHALTDAILGAVCGGDIGSHFPDSDPRWRGADSALFLEEAMRLMRERGYGIGNVDVNVLLEHPKLAAHRDTMRHRLAEMLGVPIDAVNLKAKTNEGMGEIGSGDAIAALAVIGLVGGDPAE